MESKKLEPPGVHVWLIMLKSSQAVGKLVAASLVEHDLGDSDFRVLEVLLHKGPLPVNTIGPKVNLTPGSISTAVDRLLSRGLVDRTGLVGDRRVRLVSLTTTGRALIEPIFLSHAALLERVMSTLASGERQHLEALLKKIGLNAEALIRESKSPTDS